MSPTNNSFFECQISVHQIFSLQREVVYIRFQWNSWISRFYQNRTKFYQITPSWPETIWIEVLTSTATASKYISKRPTLPTMCINSNPSFQTQIYLVKRPLKVNIVKQDLSNKKQFLKNLWSEVWKGRFQLMQILGPLGMYFVLQ